MDRNAGVVRERAGRTRALGSWSYVVTVHLALLVAAVSPETVCRLQAAVTGDPSFGITYRGLLRAHHLEDRAAPEGSVVFVGDSNTERMDTRVMTPERALNFGISGDTLVGLAQRLPLYRSIRSARTVVLAIGVNDLAHAGSETIAARLREVLAGLPPRVPVIVSGVLPIHEPTYRQANITYLNGRRIDNARIRELNARIRGVSGQFPSVVFVDATRAMVDGTGNLEATFTVDGVHLTEAGYRAWASVLAPALATPNLAGARPPAPTPRSPCSPAGTRSSSDPRLPGPG